MKITGIHRVELLVEDPAAVAETFNELFDIDFSHDPDTADYGTKCYMAAAAGLELAYTNLLLNLVTCKGPACAPCKISVEKPVAALRAYP